jgi:hypothetical protein
VFRSRPGLLYEFLKQGNDATDYGSVSLKHHEHRKPSARFSLAQRYAEGEICLHVHFLVRDIRNKTEPSYHCAVYEWADSGLNVVEVCTERSPFGVLNGCVDEAQPTMLVNDVEFVDVPQHLRNGGGVVRLKPLDKCEWFWLDAGKLVRVYGRPRSRVIEDWKARSILRDERLAVHERVGGVVKGGTECMDAFPNETRPLFKRGVLNYLGSPEESMPLVLRVVLNEHSIRVTTQKSDVFRAQLTEVFFSPLELHASAAERIGTHRGQHGT